jgi:ATP-dependent RNA helicase RhlE
MSFERLNIIEPILRALKKEGYTSPTPIQEQAIIALLDHRDLLGSAQTGTGKTAAFAIPIIQQLYNEKTYQKGKKVIKALVLTPTRELAYQIGKSFSTYGEFAGLKNAIVVGGVSQKSQEIALRSGVDILVATPGRLLDLIGQREVNLRNVEFFVLDEADHMLDMGFIKDVEKIIAVLPEKKQTMLFSATIPPEIDKLAHHLLVDPVRISLTPDQPSVESINQTVYHVSKTDKTKLLIHLLKDDAVVSALVFSRTKHGADNIAKKLIQEGITCEVIHSNKAQFSRQQALNRFKNLQSRVLVATDIVARGIDIDELSHVINYNLPEVPESYVHRIGRTGRAGLGGAAISFCDTEERSLLKGIEKYIKKDIDVEGEHPYALIFTEEDPKNRVVKKVYSSDKFRSYSSKRRSRPKRPSGPSKSS